MFHGMIIILMKDDINKWTMMEKILNVTHCPPPPKKKERLILYTLESKNHEHPSKEDTGTIQY